MTDHLSMDERKLRTTFQVLDARDFEVSKAWEHFVSGSTLDRSPVREVVIKSWQRCRHSKVNLAVDVAPQLDSDILGSLRRKNRELLQAAAPTPPKPPTSWPARTHSC